MIRWFRAALAALVLTAAPAVVPLPAVAATTSSPAATVRSFHEKLLDVMRAGPGMSSQQRFDRLEPAVRQAFDMQLMARIASGPAWSKADTATRERLKTAFERFSTAFYASQFRGGPGTHFDMEGTAAGPGNTKLVKTKLLLPSHKSVELVYVMRQDVASGDWQIVDVLLDGGISQLAQRRSEYHRIASNQGAKALVQVLNHKADQLLASR